MIFSPLTIATGFLAIGAKSLSEGNFAMDLVDDQIDTVSQSMLGLTVACARCHDHKFDPIPTADYYALAGIFKSTATKYGRGLNNRATASHKLLHVLGPDAEKTITFANARESRIKELTQIAKKIAADLKKLQSALPKDWKAQLADSKANGSEENVIENKAIAQFLAKKEETAEVAADLTAAKATEIPEMDYAMGVADAKNIADTKVHIRGEPKNLGKIVPRGFLSAVNFKGARPPNLKQSGRLELAFWIADERNPLTARVMTNRVWQHLFGSGLVTTVDNFGINGDTPSHPELLDHLAYSFMHDHKWSIQDLIRDIVTSKAYQQASDFEESAYAIDPENRLLWRMNRKTLEAEPFRDSILMAAGKLIPGSPEWGSRIAQIGDGEVGRGENTKPLEEPFHHRAAYLPILRTRLDPFLKTFDLPEPSNPQGERIATNVPAQSLWVMNNPFVIEQSRAVAARIVADEGDFEKKLQKLFRITLSREPTDTEIADATHFFKGNESDSKRWATYAHALIASAEFRYID